jgi:hypothetical protein
MVKTVIARTMPYFVINPIHTHGMYHRIIDSKADSLVLFHSLFMGLAGTILACFPVFGQSKPPLVIFPPLVHDSDEYEGDFTKKPPFVAKNPKLIPFEEAWNKHGYKDRSGKIVLPAIYKWASPFNDYGIAPVACEKPITGKHKPYAKGQIDDVVPDNPFGCFYINEKGEKIADAYELDNGWDYPTRDGIVRIIKNGKVGLMHISGKILAVPQYTTLYIQHRYQKNGLRLWESGQGQKVRRGGCCACSDSEFGGTYGLVDNNGKEIAPAKFSGIAEFHLDSDDKIIKDVEDLHKYRRLVVLYQGKKAYVLYLNAKKELGIRRESLYDLDSGPKGDLVNKSLYAK